MDRDQFDRLSRLVAAAGTRRDTLRLVVAGALTGLAGEATLAAARKRGKARRRQRQRQQVRAEQVQFCTHLCIPCADKPLQPGANLSGCDFDGESFVDRLDLRATNLTNACFARAELRAARFNGANATGVCFLDADLTDANFRGTNVSGAVFCGADLSGADFRGSNVTQAQLDCATVACNTIRPNGTPAVPCGRGQRCCAGVCSLIGSDPNHCGGCGTRCGVCQFCNFGTCQDLVTNQFDCNRTALRSAGDSKCTTTPQTGVCVDGACTCGPNADYDRDANICTCGLQDRQQCANNQPPSPLQCCEVLELCINPQLGIIEESRCIECD